MKPRNIYQTKRLPVDLGGETRTKQSFKAECDINHILRKFQTTGALTHFNQHSAQYGDTTGIEFQNAMETVAQANTMFAELPSSLRNRFRDPATFLDFVADEKNHAEMVELGLRESPPAKPEAKPTVSEADAKPATSEAEPVSQT